MKKPSEPSLIGSAISCMLLGPISLSKIHPSIQMLIPTNIMAMVNATKAIKLDIEDDTNMANVIIQVGPLRAMAAFTGRYASYCNRLYQVQTKSAQKSFVPP